MKEGPVLPSKNDTMLSANATVMHRGRIEMVKVGSSPMKRPRMAVEYNEKIVEITTDENISAACLLTSYKAQEKALKH